MNDFPLFTNLIAGCLSGAFVGFTLCAFFPKLGRQLNELLTFDK